MIGDFRVSDHFYLVVLTIVGLCFAALRRIVDSPFGRVLTVIRDNAERAQFIGVNVRAYQLAAFVVAGFFAGLCQMPYRAMMGAFDAAFAWAPYLQPVSPVPRFKILFWAEHPDE